MHTRLDNCEGFGHNCKLYVHDKPIMMKYSSTSTWPCLCLIIILHYLACTSQLRIIILHDQLCFWTHQPLENKVICLSTGLISIKTPY